ncbi:oligosaccharide flippase family protein [Thalassospira sp. NFXS8]|uniref:oligosaccharide flippase family protein n=1 Tax=Thalassospira sp. NFXS8 TaxID=2819093 RepID=UPI0032DE8DA2
MSKILKNIFFLRKDFILKSVQAYFIFGLNAFVPLAIIPLIVPSVGINTWGMIAGVSAIGTYISIIIEGGAHLFGTREIAENRDNTSHSLNFFCVVFVLRLILSLVCGILFFLFILFFHNSFYPLDLFVPALIWGISLGLTPAWYFLGKQQILLAGICDVIPKILALSICALVINEPKDAHFYFEILAFSHVLSLFLSYFYIFMNSEVSNFYRDFKWGPYVRLSLNKARGIYFIHVFGSLYNIFPVIIIGEFFSLKAAGVYAIGDRVVRTVFNAIQPLRQVIFPKVISFIKDPNSLVPKFVGNSTIFLIVMSFLVMMLLIFFSGAINRIVFGVVGEGEIKYVIKILSVQMFIQSIFNALGINYLLPAHKDKFFFFSVLMSCSVVLVGYFVSVRPPIATTAAFLILIADSVGLICVVFFTFGADIKRRMFKHGK